MDPSLAFVDPEEVPFDMQARTYPSAPEEVGPTSIITEKPEQPKEEAGDVPIAEVEAGLNRVLNETAPDTPEVVKNQAKKLAYDYANSGEAPPEMLATINQVSNVGPDESAIKAVFESKKARGDSESETLGGLLAIALPVLVGMAIGGKRGVAAAVEGAGTHYLASKKEERERDAEIEREERRFGISQAAQEAKRKDQENLVDYKYKLKEQSAATKEERAEAARVEKDEKKRKEDAEKKDNWLANADVETKKNIYSKRSAIEVLAQLAPKIRALGKGRMGYAMDSFTPGSEAYQLNRQLGMLIPRIAKAFGDTGNIAVTEQKILKDNIFGMASTTGEVADRLDNLIETLQYEHDSMFDTLQAIAEGKGGDLRYGQKNKSGSSMPTEASIKRNIQSWKKSNKSPEAVRKALEKRGVSMPDETFEQFWGAS